MVSVPTKAGPYSSITYIWLVSTTRNLVPIGKRDQSAAALFMLPDCKREPIAFLTPDLRCPDSESVYAVVLITFRSPTGTLLLRSLDLPLSPFSAQPTARSVSPIVRGRRAFVIKLPYVNDQPQMIKHKSERE